MVNEVRAAIVFFCTCVQNNTESICYMTLKEGNIIITI